MSVEVRALDRTAEDPWTAFVSTHREGTLYHLPVWRDVIVEVFGHEPRYLGAWTDGRLTGILPLFLVRFPLLGSKLLSLPYDVGSGGPLTSDAASEQALVDRAIALADECRAGYLEIRCGEPRAALESSGLTKVAPVLISDMALDTEAAVWGRVAKDHRKAMRKAESRGVTVTQAVTKDDYRAFYDVYVRVFRDFGTPPYGAHYFDTLHRKLHDAGGVKVLLAHVDGKCVGGLVFFSGGGVLVSKFAACLPEAVPLRAYAALYGEAIRLALALGFTRLSWGTSSRQQKGLVEFKEGWGATTRPAVVYQKAVRGSAPSIERYYDSDGFAQRVWRKLPLGVTQIVGPPLNRWFC
jgi:hypothetical protein